MKMKLPLVVLPMLICAGWLHTSALAQTPRSLRVPQGGFERPLAEAPRFGNPGASPKLTLVEFRELLAHWADFDTNKNGLLEKSEVPELFGKLFDAADINHDGALDEHERALVRQQPSLPAAPAPASAASPTTTSTSTTK
jgi:hypothetical protein